MQFGCREAFDALVKKMHVASLQRQAPQSSPKSASTGHAFLPATSLTMSTADAAAMTEQLRHAQQAVNQEVTALLAFQSENIKVF